MIPTVLIKPGHPAPVLVKHMARTLRTVSQFASAQPFTEPQLRWWIFQAEQNGIATSGAIVRLGRRVYIDADGFDRWIAAQNPARPGDDGRVQA